MIKAVFYDMEYDRSEINEPINIDIILQSISNEVLKEIKIDVIYRSSMIEENVITDDISLILISSKVSSEDKLVDLLDKNTNKVVIVGGVIATYKYQEIVSRYENVICCIGEGETNINDILKCFITNNKIKKFKLKIIEDNIPNIYLSIDGIHYQTNRSSYDISLEKCAVRHSKSKKTLNENGLVRIESSRGCPWNKCSFCVIPWKFYNRDWAAFPISKTIEEITYLSGIGAKKIYFTDEDFIGNKEHLEKLFSTIKEQKIKNKINQEIVFWGSTSVYTLMRLGNKIDTYLKLIKDAGVEGLFIGIESGSNNQLLRYNKGITVDDNSVILAKMEEIGIIVDVGFIMFDIEVTMNEIEENMRFIYNNRLHKSISRLIKKIRIIPHTKLYEKYQYTLFNKMNDITLEYDYNFYDSSIVILTSYLDKIDKLILDSIYLIQKEMRGNEFNLNKQDIDKMVFYRDIEYKFIEKCLERYKFKGFLDEKYAKEYYNEIEIKWREK
jgi:radical SAM superfamily enzyme YgiQ (UPF0313 family)